MSEHNNPVALLFQTGDADRMAPKKRECGRLLVLKVPQDRQSFDDTFFERISFSISKIFTQRTHACRDLARTFIKSRISDDAATVQSVTLRTVLAANPMSHSELVLHCRRRTEDLPFNVHVRRARANYKGIGPSTHGQKVFQQKLLGT